MKFERIISVIIPTYNYGKYISKLLDSLINQLSNDVEVIIVDDGSIDNTREIVKPYLTENVIYYYKGNGGVASARNFGINKSKGQYLIFIDADDEVLNGSIVKLKEIVINHSEIDLIIGNYEAFWSKNKSKTKIANISDKRKINLINFLIKKTLHVPNGSYLVHRKIFEKGLFPEKFITNEDIPVIAQILSNLCVYHINDTILRVNKHDDSLRRNINHSVEIDTKLVDEIFCTQRICESHLNLKNKYLSVRYLSLFRQSYKINEYSKAKNFYLKSVAKNPFNIINLRNLFIFLKITILQ